MQFPIETTWALTTMVQFIKEEGKKVQPWNWTMCGKEK